MQVPGANLASSIVGAADAKSRDAAAKLRAKRQAPRPEAGRPYGDEAIVHTEASDAVRSMKGNDQEEAREDREEHAGYNPHAGDQPRPRPTLDLEG